MHTLWGKQCQLRETIRIRFRALVAQKAPEDRLLLVFATFLPLVVLLAIWVVLAAAGFAVSETVFVVTITIGLVIWFLAIMPMFAISYAARFTS
jgi:hypothetical protein